MADNVVSIDAQRSALDFALRYARLGWWVLPLDPGTKKPLGRLVPKGFHDATNDADTIRKWWATTPEAGIGVALRKSGLVAVDIDPRNGGIGTIEVLEAEHGEIVSDVLALTGGGGEHRVFSASLVEGLPGTLGPGVDLKADGYIAVEPTLHPSGVRYGWELMSNPLDGVVPSTLPGWIRDLSRSKQTVPSNVPSVPSGIPKERAPDLMAALSSIKQPDRDTWWRVGMAINNALPNQEGFSLWDKWSQDNGGKYDPQDQIRVWKSFTPIGLAGVGLDSIFRIALDGGWRKSLPAKIVPDDDGADDIPMLSLEQLESAMRSVTWSVKNMIPEDSIGFMFGGSGTFKSFIALDYGLHVAHGLPWLGRKTKAGPVIFIAAEGGAGLSKRASAWYKQNHQVSRTAIPFHVIPKTLTLNTDAKKVVAKAKKLGVAPALVIIDTLSQTFDGDENSAKDVVAYLKTLATEFRELWRCVVLVVHHTGHSATERPRGSSALRANADFMFGVFRDEKQMIATLESVKIKDGELLPDQTFSLTSHNLWRDEDGEQISSLAASAVTGDALAETLITEAKAGRGGRNTLLLALANTAMPEKELRSLFYEAVDAKDMDARKHAYHRAKEWSIKHGYLEFAQGHVLVLKSM